METCNLWQGDSAGIPTVHGMGTKQKPEDSYRLALIICFDRFESLNWIWFLLSVIEESFIRKYFLFQQNMLIPNCELEIR